MIGSIFLSEVAVAEHSVTLSTSKSVVEVDEEFLVTVESSSPGPIEKFGRPKFEGGTVLDSTVASVVTQSAGKKVEKETRIYRVKSSVAGEILIGPAYAIYNQKRVESDTLKVDVLSNRSQAQVTVDGATIAGCNMPDELPALLLCTQQTDVFPGQPVVVEWVIVSDEPVVQLKYELPDLPSHVVLRDYKSARFSKMPKGSSAVLSKVVIFPPNVGSLTIDSSRVDVQMASRGWLTLESQGAILTVSDIAGMKRGVLPSTSRFRLALDKDKTEVGDGFTVSLLVETEGDISSFTPPKLEVSGLLIESPTVLGTTSQSNGSRHTTTTRFGYWSRATRAGRIEIPPVSFEVANYASGALEVVDTNAVSILAIGDTIVTRPDIAGDWTSKAGKTKNWPKVIKDVAVGISMLLWAISLLVIGGRFKPARNGVREKAKVATNSQDWAIDARKLLKHRATKESKALLDVCDYIDYGNVTLSRPQLKALTRRLLKEVGDQ